MAQALSSRFPTAAVRVRSQLKSCRIRDAQSGIGVGYLRALRFALPILIPPTALRSSNINWSWYNRPNNDRGTKWTRSHPTLLVEIEINKYE
jgi:hypothetical protein